MTKNTMMILGGIIVVVILIFLFMPKKADATTTQGVGLTQEQPKQAGGLLGKAMSFITEPLGLTGGETSEDMVGSAGTTDTGTGGLDALFTPEKLSKKEEKKEKKAERKIVKMDCKDACAWRGFTKRAACVRQCRSAVAGGGLASQFAAK
jgi:hypothetical protein